MINNVSKRTILPGIDIMKLIMSLFVVAIHVRLSCIFDGRGRYLLDLLFSIAVPYFFVVFGYLMVITSGNIKKNIRRIFKIYVIWTLIYLPLSIYGEWTYSNNLLKIGGKLLKNFLFLGESFYSWQLWFLLACVVGLFIIFLLQRITNNDIEIIICLAILYLTGMIMDWFHENGNNNLLTLYYSVFRTTRNGVFYGALYIQIGIMIAKYKKIIQARYAVPLMIFFVIADVLIDNAYISKIILLPISFCAFCVSTQIGYGLRSQISVAIRKLSTGIYLLHMYFVAIYRVGFVKQSTQYNYLLAFAFVVLCSCISFFMLSHIKIKGRSLSSILKIT